MWLSTSVASTSRVAVRARAPRWRPPIKVRLARSRPARGADSSGIVASGPSPTPTPAAIAVAPRESTLAVPAEPVVPPQRPVTRSEPGPFVRLITGGGCGIWWLIEFIMAVAGKRKDKEGLPITKW